MRENALAFCDQFGTEAHRLGWTAPELFAVHPEHRTVRLDACGVMMVGIEPARRRTEPHPVRAHVRLSEQSGAGCGACRLCGIPVWEFARSSTGQ